MQAARVECLVLIPFDIPKWPHPWLWAPILQMGHLRQQASYCTSGSIGQCSAGVPRSAVRGERLVGPQGRCACVFPRPGFGGKVLRAGPLH